MKAIFVGLSLTVSAASTAVMGHRSFFPEGGLDPFGYTYWTTSSYDSKPLTLVRKGQRKEAFEYCLTHIDKASGEQRAFYVAQAAALGYGLKRPHEVAAIMASHVNKKVGVYDSEAALGRVSPQDWLLYAYTLQICGLLAGEPENKYSSWDQMSQQRAFRFSPAAHGFVAKTNYREAANLHLKAMWAFCGDQYTIARKLMTQVVEEIPNQPGAHLTLCRFWTYGSTSGGAADGAKARAILADVRKRWPNYDRAIYWDGVYGTRYKDPGAAKKLLEAYVKMNTGPRFEIESAKRGIAAIEKGR